MRHVATVPIGANATYAVRNVMLVCYQKRPTIGVIEIRESSGKRKSISRYAVREEPNPNVPDRIFRVVKPVDIGGHYFVCIAGDSAAFHQCECRGYESGGTCKHIQAIEALIRTDHI